MSHLAGRQQLGAVEESYSEAGRLHLTAKALHRMRACLHPLRASSRVKKRKTTEHQKHEGMGDKASKGEKKGIRNSTQGKET